METGWTGVHGGGQEPAIETENITFCQGEGRGFESRLPLQEEKKKAASSWADVRTLAGSVHGSCPSPPITCPSRDMAAGMDAAKGSIRQRGSSSFELRLYEGTDPVSGRRRWASIYEPTTLV